MTIDEATELARRSIYHTTFRDEASGGVANGNFSFFVCVLIENGWVGLCVKINMMG